MVTTQALIEFKQLYKDEYGVDLENQVALEKAERLLMLVKAVYRPIKGSGKYGSGYEKNRYKKTR